MMTVSFTDVVVLIGILLQAFIAWSSLKVRAQNVEIKAAVNGSHTALQDKLDTEIKKVQDLLVEKRVKEGVEGQS